MSESSPETNPQILVNGEQQEQQQGADAATAEEEIPSVNPDDESPEDSAAAEKEKQAKMQSALQQVRNQIRSQVVRRAPKSGILELVQRVRERETEMAQANGEPEGKDVNGEEERPAEMSTDETDPKEEELCAVFEEKLEASNKALRDEFEEQVSQVRKEMQAYTDKALKDLECKMQSWQSHILQQTHPREQQESKGPDKRQKPQTTPSMASRRGRVLTRTMTTIIPKTCPPVIVGPRAKSETLASSKGKCSRLLSRDPALSLAGNKPYQGRKPLPPACPPLHQRKKPDWAKAKAGN